MSELVKLVAVLAIFFLLIGIAWLIAWKLGLIVKSAPARKNGKDVEDGAVRHIYVLKKSVLSDGEREFLPVLEQALPLLTAAVGAPTPPRLLMHVNLADLVEPKPFSHAARNQINQKHVDFVLCRSDNFKPLLVIEFDDSSHNSEKQRARDETKDYACKSAELPMLRVRALSPGTSRDPKKLAEDMRAALAR